MKGPIFKKTDKLKKFTKQPWPKEFDFSQISTLSLAVHVQRTFCDLLQNGLSYSRKVLLPVSFVRNLSEISKTKWHWIFSAFVANLSGIYIGEVCSVYPK